VAAETRLAGASSPGISTRSKAGPLNLRAGLSPEVADAAVAFSVTPRSVQAWIDEGRGMPDSLAQAGGVTSLGTVPLIVLSRGLDQQPGWSIQQAGLLQLSSNSQQRFADQSAHNVEFDQPDAAVRAIADMVEQVRGQRR
jgi:hypothetical protein